MHVDYAEVRNKIVVKCFTLISMAKCDCLVLSLYLKIGYHKMEHLIYIYYTNAETFKIIVI